MCLVWFAKIASYIFVFAYICKYSAFLRPSVYKIQCNFESGSVKFNVILKTHLATLYSILRNFTLTILVYYITHSFYSSQFYLNNFSFNRILLYRIRWLGEFYKLVFLINRT